MKWCFWVVISLYAATSSAYELNLTSFDQEKLASLVERLPLSVRFQSSQAIWRPIKGEKVISKFPLKDKGFQFVCESNYFNNSSYPSSSRCNIHIDEHHPLVDLNYDEFRIEIQSEENVSALYNGISYNNITKEFRAEKRVPGVTFEGKDALLFSYYFKCTKHRCILKFLRETI